MADGTTPTAVDSEGTLPTTARNYVGGNWVAPDESEYIGVINPATSDEIATVPLSSQAAVDDAVHAAADAFQDWRETPVTERVQYLYEFRDRLQERKDELAEVLTQEHGKTVDEAKGEIQRGIENVEVACGMPEMLRSGSGIVEDVAPGVDETARRQPLGVFAAITPFNFPAMIPLWFLPYAIATGNTFVLKPSERVPLSSHLIVSMLEDTGIPDGVVNLVNGREETVTRLLEHDGVEGISFVGSTPVAREIYETGAANGKRVQAQGGAKNYAVVTESVELETAVSNIIGSVYGNAGERCLANDVVVGVGDVYDDLRERVVSAAQELTVGNGLDGDTDVGPLITPESRDRVTGLIERAIDEGADLVLDGRDFVHPDYPDGFFMGPTILEGVTGDMEIAQTEIFGPVMCLSQVDDLDDAIEMVNGTDYGNASSIYTERGGEARHYKYEVDAGNIGVNVGVCAPMAFFHFGGRKDSFFGDLHAQGEDAVSFYTEKTVVIERWFS